MVMPFNSIPVGWQKVNSGCVEIGDKIWATATNRFIDVDKLVLEHLAFLDAMSVEECCFVIRRDNNGH